MSASESAPAAVSSGLWDRDRHFEPTPRSWTADYRGVVGASDCVGDRQAEPYSVRVVETLIGAGEGLEQSWDLLGGDARPCVGDLEYRAVGLLDRADSDPATRVV